MRKLLLVALLLCAPITQTNAQQVVIGTDYGAPTTREAMGWSSDILQTFVARGDFLTSLTFWFYGGQNAPQKPSEDQFSIFDLFQGDYHSSLSMYHKDLSQLHQGRFDLVFGNPLSVILGSTYTFRILSNNCGDLYSDGGCGVWGMPIGDKYRFPEVEVTTVDAYADGMFDQRFGEPNPDRDVRFEAVFLMSEPSSNMHLVPEPNSAVILAVGLAGLAKMARRRRA